MYQQPVMKKQSFGMYLIFMDIDPSLAMCDVNICATYVGEYV